METEKSLFAKSTMPRYTFLGENSQFPKINVKKFHCCFCLALLGIFAMVAIAITFLFIGKQSEANVNSNISSPLDTLMKLKWPLQEEKYNETILPTLDDQIKTLEVALDDLKEKELIEDNLPSIPVDSPSFRAQLATYTTREARDISRYGYLLNFGAKEIIRRANNDNRTCTTFQNWKFNEPPLLFEDFCESNFSANCPQSLYRTANGFCNNRNQDATWGAALKPFRRLLLPNYSDGVSAPRKSSRGKELPSARQVSLSIHRPVYKNDVNFTVMLAVWGQFIDHDITATALSKGKNGTPISCCQNNSKSHSHPECFSVNLEKSDPFYKKTKVLCLEFVRSAPALTCHFGPREQLNQVTSFLDGSVVYGSNEEIMNQLRTFKNGELKMLKTQFGELLPVSNDFNDGCNREEESKRGRYCFLSGDARANENLLLTSMHLLFARHHNTIARKLNEINPNWSDEKIFQETRKIIGAQIQHITYHEFLPNILPQSLLKHLNMTNSSGYSNNYNSSINPTIANSFASAAFRFGHTLLPGLIQYVHENQSREEYIELHKMLFNPFKLYKAKFLRNFMKGALNTSTEKADVYFSKEVTKKLFQRKKEASCGLDLVSLNIQRGRDHGLPSYPNWRKICGLSKLNSFDDLENDFDAETLKKLRILYKSVDDLDLYTGALSEKPINGGLLGPTFTCMLADQFFRLKVADRFWYETIEKPQRFSLVQLNEIRKTTLAKIICETSEVNELQVNVMRRVGPNNALKNCSDFSYPNLIMWKV